MSEDSDQEEEDDDDDQQDDGWEDADQSLDEIQDDAHNHQEEEHDSEDENDEESDDADPQTYQIEVDHDGESDEEDGPGDYPIEFGDEDDGIIVPSRQPSMRGVGRRAGRRNFFSDMDNRVEIRVEGGPGGFGIIDDGAGFEISGRGMRGNIADPAIAHPLLINESASRNPRADSRARDAGPRGLDLSSFDELLGGHAMQLLEQVFRGAMNSRVGGSATMRLEIPSGDLSTRLTNSLRETPPTSIVAESGIDMIHLFSSIPTNDRWQQEAKLLLGAAVNEKAGRILNYVLNALVPSALEEDNKRKIEEEVIRKAREELEKKRAAEAAELQRQKDEERKRIEDENAAKKSQEEEERAAELAAREEDVTMEEAQPTSSSVVPMETESASPSRVFVSINGAQVDITGLSLFLNIDSGIDVEFLEALPDDLRQEVLDQHLREQRQAQSQSQSLSISDDFLDALPPDIREEIIQQERAESARREREASRIAGGGPSGIDPNNFLAALDPALRQSVLSEQDPDFLAALPAHLVAEANAMRERLGMRFTRAPRGELPTAAAASPKKNVHRDAVQLIDKNALMSLLRLLFVPEPVSKTLIHRLLINVSENSKTRSELLTIVLCILSEGCNDLASVDKTFSAMSRPKSSGKGLKKGVKSGNIPNLVEVRCLETIIQLVNSNDQAIAWFLAENETFFTSLGKTPRSLKKGKGKPLVNSKNPVIVLLWLLDSSSFLLNSNLMEQLMFVLSLILKPSPIVKPSISSSAELSVSMDTAKSADTIAAKEAELKKEEAVELRVPRIPDQYVRSAVNVLTGSDCPNKTFGYTMTVIQHLLTCKEYEVIVVNQLVNAVHMLGLEIIPDLDKLTLLIINSIENKTSVGSSVLTIFSKPSSTQSKLLRVLKSLDFIFSKSLNKPKPQVDPLIAGETKENKEAREQQNLLANKEEKESSLRAIYDDFKLTKVWNSLGKCLEMISAKSDLINIGTVLLPLIESFLVVSKPYVSTNRNLNINFGKGRDTATLSNEELFVSFTEEHRKLLNTMVRSNTSLMSGSFSLLVQNPKVLDFDNKRTYFNQQLHKRSQREHYGSLQLNVRRSFVFEDSYQQLQGRTGPEIKYGKLAVRFYEEEGVDAGGVTREWFSVLARQLFNPNYALFKPSAVDKITYQPNRSSWINPDHLFYFKFVGRIIGKAIYDGRLLDCYFTRSFYKCMLEAKVDWKDMEAVDPEFHKSLEWILNNDITDLLDITFSCEIDDFGKRKIVDLKPNGANIVVTQENKHEYVTLITEQKLEIAIKDQIKWFLDGFHDIIPKELIKIFNEQELELLISGLPDIDVDDWKSNTEYQNYSSTSIQVQWFWRVVRSFTQEERAKLIQFITGTSKVPLEGFSNLQGSNGIQKFQIHKDFGPRSRLPSAHTWFTLFNFSFNQLDLPEYETYEQLRLNLLTAMNEGATGFGFA